MTMVFFGKWRGGGHGHDSHGHGHGHGGHEPHEVPWNMWLPIAVLSVFAVLLGWAGTPFVAHNWFHHYVSPGEETLHHGAYLVMGLSVLVGAVGIGLGWAIYGRKTMAHAEEPDPLQAKLGALFTCLNQKWYVDEFYEATLIRATFVLAAIWKWFDKTIIDGILHAIAKVSWHVSQVVRWVGDEFFINGGFDTGCESVRQSGRQFAKLQGGRIQDYLRVLCLGVALLLVVWFLV
jgi:NADH-quinone oxidoreductase subunit L